MHYAEDVVHHASTSTTARMPILLTCHCTAHLRPLPFHIEILKNYLTDLGLQKISHHADARYKASVYQLVISLWMFQFINY